MLIETLCSEVGIVKIWALIRVIGWCSFIDSYLNLVFINRFSPFLDCFVLGCVCWGMDNELGFRILRAELGK